MTPLAANFAALLADRENLALEVELLGRLAELVSQDQNLDHLLHEVLHILGDRLGYLYAAVLLLEGEELEIRAAVGYPADVLQRRYRIDEGGITSLAAKRRELIYVPDVSAEPRYIRITRGTRSEVAVPLTVHEGVLGVLDVESAELESFSASDLRLLRLFAHHAALAIANARLRERVQALAVLEDRQRIARELHDSVSQVLFSLTLNLEWARRQVPQPGALADRLAAMRDLAQEGLNDIRNSIYGLSARAVPEGGLVSALQELRCEIEQLSGVAVGFQVRGTARRLPALTELHIYRVAREALFNAYRHAGARTLSLQLRFSARAVTLLVGDDGVGMSPGEVQAAGERATYGIKSMRRRVEELGGSFDLRSRPGRGTVVRVTVPLAV
jgi:signal transduction histidine kinase